MLKNIVETWQDIPGYFSEENAKFYKEIYDSMREDGIFIEIGSFYGRSTAYMCSLFQEFGHKFNFVQVDTWEGTTQDKDHKVKYKDYGDYYEGFLNNMETLNYQNFLTPKKMTSLDAAKEFPDNIIDCVFIDGDHSYESVSADLKAWVRKLKPDGIICGHDIDFPGVWRAVNRQFKEFSINNNIWISRKDLYVNRPEY